jgi:hypothetical protein
MSDSLEIYRVKVEGSMAIFATFVQFKKDI